jgi:hypothetical protein
MVSMVSSLWTQSAKLTANSIGHDEIADFRRLNLGKHVACTRARICKRLRSPGIDSKESIPPAYVARRAGTSNRFVVLACKAGNRFLGSLIGLQIRVLYTKVVNGGDQREIILTEEYPAFLPTSSIPNPPPAHTFLDEFWCFCQTWSQLSWGWMLGRNPDTSLLRVFLLGIHSHLYSFALRFLFLQTHATSYSFYSSVSYCTL